MPSARRHTVVLSDVHLSQTHPRDDSDPLWMRYRRDDYHPDADFEGFIDALLAKSNGEPITLVFNGDLFDFDAPVVKDGTSTAEEYPLDDAGCTAQLERIVSDHPRFVRATARLLVEGHSVLFVSGNHDVELYWPGVRRALRTALRKAARALSDAALPDLEDRILFRTWFHVTEDGIYLEHGSQYDMLNGMPDPMLPLVRDQSSIKPLCGKLGFKRMGARMGYFNPYCEDTFYMGLTGYLSHFFTQYLFSKRHIVRTWVFGAVSTVLSILTHRQPVHDKLHEDSVERAIGETDATREAVLATHALRTPPAEKTMLPILRELWLDRVFFIVFALGAAAGCYAFASLTIAGAVLGTLAAAFVLYEIFTPKPDIRTYDSAPPRVEQLFEIHDVRAICMGHTHRPTQTWRGEKFLGNSGSWCPAFVDAECTKPVLDGRPFLWLTTDASALSGGLHWFRNGAITAEETSPP